MHIIHIYSELSLTYILEYLSMNSQHPFNIEGVTIVQVIHQIPTGIIIITIAKIIVRCISQTHY